jgi:hypothetical protein
MADLRTALHHLCHCAGYHRVTVQMYESTAEDFTVVIDIPESQLTMRGPDAVAPFVKERRQRLLTTNPDADVIVRGYQPLMISSGLEGSNKIKCSEHTILELEEKAARRVA